MFYQLDFEFQNIHDTSCWHAVTTKQQNCNLKAVLKAQRLKPRMQYFDFSKITVNPSYWSTRPLTADMKEWAISNVELLHHCADLQKKRLRRKELREQAVTRSDIHSKLIRFMDVADNLQLQQPDGIKNRHRKLKRFLGRDRKVLNDLETRNNLLCIACTSEDDPDTPWVIFYKRPESLQPVKQAMGYTVTNDIRSRY